MHFLFTQTDSTFKPTTRVPILRAGLYVISRVERIPLTTLFSSLFVFASELTEISESFA